MCHGLILLGMYFILSTYLEEKSLTKEIDKALKSNDKNEINKALNKVESMYGCLDTARTLKNYTCSLEFSEAKDNVEIYDKDIKTHEEIQEVALKQLEDHREELRKEAKQNEWDQEPVEGATNA